MASVERLKEQTDINVALSKFKLKVGFKTYDEKYKSMGRAFEVLYNVPKNNIYVQALNENSEVVGMAYGHPKEKDDTTFFIAEIISASGSHSGSEMVNWFSSSDNINMGNLKTLELVAANKSLISIYEKKWYGFTLIDKQSGRMTRSVIKI